MTMNFFAALVSVLAMVSVCSAQVSTMRVVPVTVTDPSHRFVTGLEQENFEVVENGVRRNITDFLGVDSPIAIAIVGAEPSPSVVKLTRAEDELIQAGSLSDALRQLAGSKQARKALVLTRISESVPAGEGIVVLQTDETNVSRAVVELRNQYLLRFVASPSANVEVVFKTPRGLPPLTAHWR